MTTALSVPQTIPGVSGAAAAQTQTPATPQLPKESSSVEPSQRDKVLTEGWDRSNDLAITATGDADGFHVLAAKSSEGYSWRTVATLSEPGMNTDQWVGNACLTTSGSQVIAVYAPRHFTNRAWLFSRGAFAAVIDVKSGEVTKLKDQVSLAYYNPGCGAGNEVAFTQGTTDERKTTRLFTVDAGSKSIARAIVVQGQVTSAVATADGIVAAAGNRLVKVELSGKLKTLAKTDSVPVALHATADGGIAFMDREEGADEARVKHYRQGSVRTFASGRLGDLALHAGADGRVFVTGQARQVGDLPARVSVLGGPSTVEAVSSEGRLLIESAAHRGLKREQQSDQANTEYPGVVRERESPELIDIKAQVAGTRSPLAFAIDPARASTQPSGRAENPKLTQARVKVATRAGTAATASGTVDLNYSCSVPRNDPKTQVYQPHWRQVEWAVDQLVFKDRLQVWRQSDWKGSGVPQWNPQDLFPTPDLAGGGRIPVSVMFGILAQESNLWQAQRDVLPGETGNPLVGNYYGVQIYDADPTNDWDIRFDEADCGYGITQQTDHMRRQGHARPGEWLWDPETQRRIALDYATNIAVGLTTLAEKWNQVHADTGGVMKINNGDPAKIENWYFAIWAYNSGYYPKAQASANGGAWGVGWTNNPKNPDYPVGRRPFLHNNSYSDAAHPQRWPYQEKVLGWSAWPIAKTYYNAATGQWVTEGGYNHAWWNAAQHRTSIVPVLPDIVDVNAFCTADNECEVAPQINCTRADRKCWWHSPKTWKTCPDECGNEAYLRYDASYASIERAEPTDQWTPCLTPGLPPVSGDTTNMLIVDDVPRTVPAIRGNCQNSGWTNSGTLSFEFEQVGTDVPGRADFQQLGNGFGGHLWWAYSRSPQHNGAAMKVTGTWELNQAINSWARVIVHVPKRRAETQQAPYTVDLGNGKRQTRYLSQGRLDNSWQSLGVFEFGGTPKVSLTNLNKEGHGTAAVAFDAIAFQVLAKKPKHFVVGMGDSYASGEGVGNYAKETNVSYKTNAWNACRRSNDSWIRKTVLPGETRTIGEMADSLDPKLDFHFVACSGATTISVKHSSPSWQTSSYVWSRFRDYADGRFREISQLEAGYLDENTTLVTLSIGGNDAGFPKVVENCYLWACQGDDYEQRLRTDIAGSVNNYLRDPDGTGFVPYNVKDTLERIDTDVKNSLSSRGKKAKIVLMGYPRIFDGQTASDPLQSCSSTINFSAPEKDMLNRLSDYMATQESSMTATLKAAGREVSFANPISKFGIHGACDDDPWIIPVTFTDTGGGDFGDLPDCLLNDGVRCASRTSMHPNTKGVAAYTEVLQEHLASPAVNYTGW
ncbi:SGNH/GDSL hydrolase family protein [Nonomuraea typhae]|uniref:SGNH/GDSL hydrolase family protein n=1 Tax=Nonomuraea typhae TaxID=2603600 RepID=UPI0012FA668A|nr:SGNH/GDSL hydrolase family protein [Nonomuraea typhae]